MKVVIAGFGVEGKASYDYWRAKGDEVAIADERADLTDAPADARLILGPDAFAQLGEFDRVIRSPSVRPDKLPYGDKVWSATNEFFAQCPAPIIGVTGTKGKGTTCSLITSILRAAGKTVHLVGNIGQPALAVLPSITPDDIVVYELSSFQLWDVKKSPHIAVVLMIEPDHLDVHASLDEYLQAKSNIRRYQSLADSCVYHPTNPYSHKIAATELECLLNDEHCVSMDTAYRYAIPSENQVYIRDDNFCIQDRVICSVNNLKLPGKHNIENACAAISAVAELEEWPKVIRDEHVVEGLRSFAGLPHRLKFVAEVDGIHYYDDSIATTPGSAIAALKAFEQPKVIILGGSDKGADYTDVIEVCRETESQVLAIGQTGLVIRELCAKLGVVCTRVDSGMMEVVQKAHELAHVGDVVILSPASASFDQYRSYADRGDQFIAAVEALQSV